MLKQKFSVRSIDGPYWVIGSGGSILSSNKPGAEIYNELYFSKGKAHNKLNSKVINLLKEVKNCRERNTIISLGKRINVGTRYFEYDLFPSGSDEVLIIFRDCTEKENTKKSLLQMAQRARLLFDELPLVIWEEDFSQVKKYISQLEKKGVRNLDDYLKKNPAELEKIASLIVVNEVNKTSFKFYEADTKEELLTKIPEWFVKESWDVFRNEIVALAEGEYEFIGEIPVRSPKGRLYYLLISVIVPKNNRRRLDKVIVSFIDITERVLAEQELKKALVQQRRLAHHMEIVREEERKHIAMEIHDQLGSMLTMLAMDLNKSAENASGTKRMSDALKDMIKQVEIISNFVKTLGASLRPSIIDNLGLVPALKWYANEIKRHAALRIMFSGEIKNLKISPHIAIAVFRIFQESLNNVIKHADATMVTVTLSEKNNILTMKISDNGRGFAISQLEKTDSMGIRGMKERASMFNGQVVIKSNKGKGTTIELTIPKSQYK